MSADLDLYYDTVLGLVKKAGEVIKELNFKEMAIDTKSSDIDFVTEGDQKIEKMLITNLSSEFPGHRFIGEETVSSGGHCTLTDAPTWIIDPIDGTMNFVHSFPHSCISIALFINSEPHIGVIYNPILEQLFTARKGKGAFLNGKQIHVSGQTQMSKALLMLEHGTSRDPAKIKAFQENLQNLIPNMQGMRSLGSAALDIAMVAMGSADAYFEAGIHIWDFAAGELLIKEAGGVVMDPAGGPLDHMSRRFLCASSQGLAEQLAQKIVQYYPTPRD